MNLEQLKILDKVELMEIIDQLITINPNNKILVTNILKKSKPNYQKALKTIEKEIKNYQGSYRKAYKIYNDFVLTNPDLKDTLKLTLVILPYFFEELEAYHDYPEDLTDMVIQMYETSCKYAVDMNDIKTVEMLYEMLKSYHFSEDLNESLMNVFYDCVPYDIISTFD